MVVLREAVRLVTNVLQQPQGVRVPRELERLVGGNLIDLFFALGQRD